MSAITYTCTYYNFIERLQICDWRIINRDELYMVFLLFDHTLQSPAYFQGMAISA